jgi:hypothetical protein
VYQVLDEVLATGGVPSGVRGTMFTVVDQLRAAAPGAEELRRAERISVEMHRLEWALRLGDTGSAQAAREQLKMLAAEWIDTRISSRH